MRKLGMVVAIALAVLPAVVSAQSVETVRFPVLMSSTHENPPLLEDDASGEAVVEFTLRRSAMGDIESAIVDFRVDYHLGQPQTLTAMHIHRGGTGVNGPVVLGAAFGPQVQASEGPGRLFRRGEFTTPASIGVVMEVMENPAAFYVNVHSSSRPGGLFRGQMRPDPAQALEARLAELAEQVAGVEDVSEQIEQLRNMIRILGQVLGVRLP
jgi:hypothetical protein